ncbi:hypothetical protein [Protaetiibacter larvae]|nr:hypothetical protein [Protaetiibacter larvae]
MRPAGDGFVAIDLLGRELTGEVDWLTAEETLDATGIGYLADRFELRQPDGSWIRVRIAEVSADRIVVKHDDFGAIGMPQVFVTLGFPIPETLRVLVPGSPNDTNPFG